MERSPLFGLWRRCGGQECVCTSFFSLSPEGAELSTPLWSIIELWLGDYICGIFCSERVNIHSFPHRSLLTFWIHSIFHTEWSELIDNFRIDEKNEINRAFQLYWVERDDKSFNPLPIPSHWLSEEHSILAQLLVIAHDLRNLAVHRPDYGRILRGSTVISRWAPSIAPRRCASAS